MKIFIKVLIILIFTIGFPSCRKCDPTKPYFDVQGILLKNYNQYAENLSREMEENEKVEFEKFYLNAELIVAYYSLNLLKPNYKLNFLVNEAYAFECRDNGDKGSKEYIDTIVVVTNFDFDAKHLVNDTINDLLEIYNMDLNEYLNEYLSQDSIKIMSEGFGLKLKIKPVLSDTFSVSIHYYLTNGEYYTSVSQRIRFL